MQLVPKIFGELSVVPQGIDRIGSLDRRKDNSCGLSDQAAKHCLLLGCIRGNFTGLIADVRSDTGNRMHMVGGFPGLLDD